MSNRFRFGPMTEAHKKAISLATIGLKKPSLIGNKHSKGKHNSPDTEFKKGLTPWNKGKILIKKCITCGKIFKVIPSRNFIQNCSRKCGYKASSKTERTGIYKKCLNCNKEIYIEKNQIGRKKYCSIDCRLAHCNTTRKKELREKLSKSHLGQKAWNKGKRFPQYSEKNHPNWKGGTSFEPYGAEFNKYIKNKTRDRYDYACQLCGIKENGKNHITHHIDYNKKNNKENNLILLCNSCHSKTNFTREDWKNYFGRKELYAKNYLYQKLQGLRSRQGLCGQRKRGPFFN